MEDLIKNIKKKFSPDSLVEMMKDAKLFDAKGMTEEDVRKTLETIDTNNLIDIDELAAKLNEITEQSKKVASEKKPNSVLEKAKTGLSGVLTKTPPEEKKEVDYGLQDNITGFLD